MGIRIDPSSRKVIARIEGLDKALPRNLQRGLYFVGKTLRRTASENIKRKPRSGRVYKHKGRRHVASTPGESWANKSGAARRAMKFKVSNPTQMIFYNDVKSEGKRPINYVELLEDKNKLNRPAMLIAIKQNNKNIVTIVSDEIKKTLEN